MALSAFHSNWLGCVSSFCSCETAAVRRSEVALHHPKLSSPQTPSKLQMALEEQVVMGALWPPCKALPLRQEVMVRQQRKGVAVTRRCALGN